MFKYLLIMFILINSTLNADDGNKKREIETGFAYQNEDATQKKDDKKDELSKIRKLLEQQLKVQKDIYALLKQQYDPEPKIIMNEKGEKCVANSSADCFEMPITPEGKSIPVIKEWMQKGDLQSAANLLKWQSKYFSEISKRAYANVSAINQFGSAVYPTNYNTSGFSNVTGYNTSVLRDKIDKEVLRKNLQKIRFKYFIGENFDMDLYAMDNIVKFLNQFKNEINLEFVFLNKKSMKAFSIAGEHNKEFAILNNYHMSVEPDEFERFNIHNTPSLVAIDINKKKAQTVLVGRSSAGSTNKMILMYMRHNGLIKNVDLNTNDNWSEYSDFGHKYVKKTLGESFLKEINSKGENENETTTK